MFGSIWQIIRVVYTRRRSGIDAANIQHLRADLRFRLAMMEYAYFGRSGRRVARCLEELKSLLGDKAMHRYLRSLDPDLRTQFVERFQGARRQFEAGGGAVGLKKDFAAPPRPSESAPRPSFERSLAGVGNVVPFDVAARKGAAAGKPGLKPTASSDDTRSVDSGD